MRDRTLLLLLFVGGLLLRLPWFAISPYAVYPDPAYYDAAARALAEGRLEVPFLWSWVETGFRIPDQLSLPLPAFAHWGPLASIVAVPFVWLFGGLEFATALPHLLAAAALGPLTFLLARRLGVERPLLPALVALVGGGYGPLLAQPDNYALYALLANGALIAAASARGSSQRRWLLAGVLAGLAWLSRTDGLILAGAIGLFALGEPGLRRKIAAASAIVAGFALPALPWMARQFATFGSPIPSGSSGAIWIRTYNEQFTADGPFSIGHLFAEGLAPVLASRVDALGYFFFALLASLLVGALLPGLLIGIWGRRRDQRLLTFAIYSFAYLLWSVVFVAPHLRGGNLLHGLLALGPIVWIVSIEGTERIIAWVERRGVLRSGATTRLVRTLFPALALVGIIVPTASALPVWQNYQQTGALVVERLRAAGLDDRVIMSTSPIPLWRAGIQRAVALPLSPAATVERAARASGAGVLVLDPQHQPELIERWGGEERPAWIDEPIRLEVVDLDGERRTLYLLPLLGPPPG